MATNQFDRANYPTIEPDRLVAGERWLWRKDDLASDYPPDSYSLEYIARSHGGSSTEFKIQATEAASTYFIEVSSSTTQTYPQGHVHWQAWITRTSDSEKIKVLEGHWEISYDYDVNHDPRTHAEIMRDKIESLLEGRADNDVEEYSIGNRSLTKLSITDLMKWRDYYRQEVAKENQQARARAGKRPGNLVKVEFRRAG
jgi:hypothetical protein